MQSFDESLPVFAGATLKPGKKEGGDWGLFRRYGNLSIELVAAVLVGAFGGHWLDRWLGTTPWLFLIGFVLGAAAGFLNIFRLIASEKGEKGRL